MGMDQVAFYEKNISFWNVHSRWAVREKYIDYLLSSWRQNRFCRVIDIGCGCGQDAVILSKKLKEKDVDFEGIAVDQCQGAAKYARSRLDKLGDDNHWQLEICDFFKQVWPVKFDVAICSMLVMHYKDVTSFLNGISKCLNTNGCLLFVVNNPFLVAYEYGLTYEEGGQYTHVFKENDSSDGIVVEKFFHTMTTYHNAATNANLNVVGCEEIYDYSPEMRFFNDSKRNPFKFPNFFAFVLRKHLDDGNNSDGGIRK